jgi:hypothetical protein
MALACLALLLSGVAASAQQNAVNVSWGDHIVVSEGLGKLDTRERIGAAMDEWKRLAGADTIYWRVSDWYIGEYMECQPSGFPRYFDEVARIRAAFDPLACAVEEAHKRGLRIYAYQTIYDEGSPTDVMYGDNTPFIWQSRFTIEHPEYVVCDRTGQKRQWGVLEYACPEARQHAIGVLTRLLDDHGFDGLYVCTRTHSRPAEQADQYGFNEPVALAYREQCGVDPRTQDFDAQKWRDLRGTFLTQLLRELRTETNRRGKRLAVAIPRGDILGPPYGNMTLQWRDWVKEDLVDELVVGVTSGNWHYPSMRGKDKERGYLASQDEGWGLPPLEDSLRGDYAPLCKAHGVLLQMPGGSWGPAERARLESLGANGYMFSSLSLASRPAYVVVPHNRRLDFADGKITVECWLKYPEKVTYGRVISKYDHTIGDAGRAWEVYIDENARVVWRLNDGATDASITTEGTVPAGEWFHLACVSEGADGEMRVYVNGRQDPVTRPAPARLRSVPVALCVGCYGGGGIFLNAWVDEVRLSSTARHLDGPPQGRPPVDADTVGLWSFEETGAQATSTTGDAALTGEVMRFGGAKRGDGPPGCGQAVWLGK